MPLPIPFLNLLLTDLNGKYFTSVLSHFSTLRSVCVVFTFQTPVASIVNLFERLVHLGTSCELPGRILLFGLSRQYAPASSLSTLQNPSTLPVYYGHLVDDHRTPRTLR